MRNFVLTVILLMFSVALTAADLSGWTLRENGPRRQRQEIINYSPVVGKVLKLNFVPAAAPYLELYDNPPKVWAVRPELLRGALTLDVYSPTPAAIRQISLRFTDSRDETYQLSQPLKLRPGEWVTVRFDISTATRFSPIYGGDNNKQIDYPLKWRGITVDFDSGWKGEAEILITDFKWIK